MPAATKATGTKRKARITDGLCGGRVRGRIGRCVKGDLVFQRHPRTPHFICEIQERRLRPSASTSGGQDHQQTICRLIRGRNAMEDLRALLMVLASTSDRGLDKRFSIPVSP
ncbi:hypothetical protein BDM02DRAFT_1155351 [Thelephora ganbajun]|uniref:Uncharacterized protein n=1 Tax=Thelephora ganbajun TaxID=370292 RepID=A0ACB6ZX20_THEGA|nr:hypothetical protein BDM02DRAFT_1155351 [Thelephora ganbajun]